MEIFSTLDRCLFDATKVQPTFDIDCEGQQRRLRRRPMAYVNWGGGLRCQNVCNNLFSSGFFRQVRPAAILIHELTHAYQR